MLCFAAVVRADGLEYRYEVGATIGGCTYYGDANYSHPFNNFNVMGGALFRYNINPRMAVKADFAVARISGSTAEAATSFPGGGAEFGRMLYELGAQYECHFLAYGDGTGYKRSHRFAPYLLAGVGLTYAPAPAKHVFTPNFPVGVGLKCKVMPRLNVGCEITYRFTFSDNLDVTQKSGTILNDPYGIESGIMKNKDGYSFLSLFVTYDLSPKYRKCNN
ncbi:MAG: hypothetical protein J6Q73_05680 [Bacteroidaceae bacterium]|nr:hypothetical protein [Bacteroidaceae bacterium]